MSKKTNLDERIIKVRNDRYELLSMVSDNIKNNRNILLSDMKSIFDVLEYDEKTIKRYTAVVKAQELIKSLTEEICYAQSEEEIIELRKKINYLINKIKAELKRRNIDDNSLSKYQESANCFRKNIAQFIRVIKRESNINNIENTYKKYNLLSEEEKEEFNKQLKREMRYNHRNLYPKETVKKENKKEEDTNKLGFDPITIINDNKEEKESSYITIEVDNKEKESDLIKIIPSKEEETSSQDKECFTVTPPSQKKKENRVINSISDIDESDIEFLKIKIKSFDQRYNISSPYEYGKSVFNGISSIIKNIPIYKSNKLRIKQMISESKTATVGSDFKSYIAYLIKTNSIKHGLKSIFNKSYLYSSEGQLLNKHEKCAEWLIDYCQKNRLELSFLNRTMIR